MKPFLSIRRPTASASRQGLAGVLLVGWLIAVSACTNRADTSETPDADAVAPADADPSTMQKATLAPGDHVSDVTFRTIDGGRHQLDAFDGPVLINFWATSCAVCLEEAPELIALRERLAARGYEMISVAMPYDRPDAVLELATGDGWPQPVAIDLDGTVLAAFEPVPGTPTNFLLASDRTLIERHVGRLDVAALEDRVLELLADH